MARGSDVLKMLRPNGGWIITEDDYDSIQFIHAEPLTRAEFEAGFSQYDAWKAEQDAAKIAKRDAAINKLNALGLTTDDLEALGF